MGSMRWLVSWIGNADHEAAEGVRPDQLGPIATALQRAAPFERVVLLTNYAKPRSQKYCKWLAGTVRYAESRLSLSVVRLDSPIDYAAIYQCVSEQLKALSLPADDIELTFHLSPGTPAMAAIWIILSKTRFPANLIQTSTQRGLEAVDFPFDLAGDFLPEYLKRNSERMSRLVARTAASAPEFDRILHVSDVMAEQVGLARRMAAHDVPVLILGETGTGKELFAEAIHAASPRASGPFIAVNCGAIPAELASSELFGHKRGAFTGATSDRKGHFQEAQGGTLFLDEVGELPLDSQVRLLRALQAREVTPLGASKPIRTDVRILAATHRDLPTDVASGRFREDLFHRLAVGILRLPPLRARGPDVELLFKYFLDVINQDAKGKPEAQAKDLAKEALQFLCAQSWPGNVREAYHTLLRAALWSNGPVITLDDVQASLVVASGAGGPHTSTQAAFETAFSLRSLLDSIARQHIERAMKLSGGRKSRAAELLGFSSHQTLTNWIQRLEDRAASAGDHMDAGSEAKPSRRK
jgi:DNA-binding NtrC family response regulator